MSRLLHPATEFLQSLPVEVVKFEDMTPEQQRSVWNFMFSEGDGVWVGHCGSIEDAIKLFGDVVFEVGRFPNSAEMKVAFAATEDRDESEDPVEWFDRTMACDASAEALPVILNQPDAAGEFGFFGWGHEHFYDYWCKQDSTEFIRFLPSWRAWDKSGRGGQ